MRVELLEGNGIAALAKPVEESSGMAIRENGMLLIGIAERPPAASETAEGWVEQDFASVTGTANTATPAMSEAEEARILADPDVAEAIDATLPEIEAFERA